MAAAIVQQAFTIGSGTTIGFTLPNPPSATGTNYLVILMSGNDNAVAPTGFVTLFGDSIPNNAALYAAYRLVQPGDTAGPYTYTGLGAGYDGGGIICEVTGAAAPTVYAEGNSYWSGPPSSYQSPSGMVNTTAGSLVMALFNVYTGSSLFTSSPSDGVTESFTMVFDGALATTANNRSYQIIATRTDLSASTANPTATMANVTTPSGLQSQATIVIPAAPTNLGRNYYGNTATFNTLLVQSVTTSGTLAVNGAMTGTSAAFSGGLRAIAVASQANAIGGVIGYAPPVFTPSGSSTGATEHIVRGSVAIAVYASNTYAYTTITLSGSAAFSAYNTYTVAVSVQGTGTTLPSGWAAGAVTTECTRISATQLVLYVGCAASATSSGTVVVDYIAVGY